MRLVSVPGVPKEEVRPLVVALLEGEDLVLFGGDGPLLAALHLAASADRRVEGEPLPLVAGLPPGPPSSFTPVTGVGYALYRCADECIALWGPRGDGRVLHLGCESADEPVAAAATAWFSRKTRAGPRSIEGSR